MMEVLLVRLAALTARLVALTGLLGVLTVVRMAASTEDLTDVLTGHRLMDASMDRRRQCPASKRWSSLALVHREETWHRDLQSKGLIPEINAEMNSTCRDLRLSEVHHRLRRRNHRQLLISNSTDLELACHPRRLLQSPHQLLPRLLSLRLLREWTNLGVTYRVIEPLPLRWTTFAPEVVIGMSMVIMASNIMIRAREEVIEEDPEIVEDEVIRLVATIIGQTIITGIEITERRASAVAVVPSNERATGIITVAAGTRRVARGAEVRSVSPVRRPMISRERTGQAVGKVS